MTSRLLHIIEPDSGAARPAAAALLADVHEPEDATLVVGGTAAERLLRTLGVQTEDRLARTCGRLPFGIPSSALRRYIAAIGPVSAVQVWSPQWLPVVLGAMPGVAKVAMLTIPPPSMAAGRWLSAVVQEARRRAPLQLVAISHAIAAGWCNAGIPPDDLEVIPAGLRWGRLAHAERSTVRSAWGIPTDDLTPPAASSRVLVIAVPTPPDGRPVNAARLGRFTALCRLVGLEVRVVTGPRTWRRDLGYALGRVSPAPSLQLSVPGCPEGLMRGHAPTASPSPGPAAPPPVRSSSGVSCVVLDDRMDTPWRLFPACDVVFIAGDDRPLMPPLGAEPAGSPPAQQNGRHHRRGRALWKRSHPLTAGPVLEATAPDVLALQWAMASGKPIIAEASRTVTEWVTPDLTALITPPGDDDAVLARIRQLAGDPDLAWRLGDAARAEAYQVGSRQRFRSALADLRARLIGNAANA